jgi:hypothetical protein
VTTGSSLVTITTPSVSNGFEFTIRKVDGDIGVVIVTGVSEFLGSSNDSSLIRQNQTITYKFDGSNWSSYVVDDGVLSAQTMLANMGSTYSHATEFPVIDLHDSVQKSLNYSQGGWSYDWLSGTVFSSYKYKYFDVNLTNHSMFNTSSNSFIGNTSSPLTVKSYSLSSGKSIRMTLTGTVSSVNGTASIKYMMGGYTMSNTSIQLGSISNLPWRIDYDIKTSDVGASGSVHCSGLWICNGASSSIKHLMYTASAYQPINTTIDNNMDLLLTLSGTNDQVSVISSTIERLS